MKMRSPFHLEGNYGHQLLVIFHGSKQFSCNIRFQFAHEGENALNHGINFFLLFLVDIKYHKGQRKSCKHNGDDKSSASRAIDRCTNIFKIMIVKRTRNTIISLPSIINKSWISNSRWIK